MALTSQRQDGAPGRCGRTTALHRSRHLFPALLVALLLASACSGSNDSDPAVGTSSTAELVTTTTSEISAAEITTSETSTSGEGADGPSTAIPARVQLDWFVTALNAGGDLTVEEIEERFSPVFLAEIPADQLAAFIPQVFAVAEPPFAVERFEPSDDGLTAEAVLLGADDRRLTAVIAVTGSTPNLIMGLGIEPAEFEIEFPVPIDVDAIDARLAEFGQRSSLGVYEVTDGDCTAAHEIRAGTTIVLGSVFKLWVLAALADEIDAGRASWDATVTVTDELRSNPAGEIYELETGTEVTLQRLAEATISISDNTATDLLLDRLGRETVEESLERIGVADPAANIPMLSTGNLFALKYLADAPNAADYRALDEAGKRLLLDDLDRATAPWVSSGTREAEAAEVLASVNVDGVPVDEPRDLDIEWFATAADLCRTFVYLDGLAETPGLEPVASILEINPGTGLPFDRDRWPAIRYKGGNEAGVVAGAWWFEGADGDRYVVAGGVANPDAPFDVMDALPILASAIELIE